MLAFRKKRKQCLQHNSRCGIERVAENTGRDCRKSQRGNLFFFRQPERIAIACGEQLVGRLIDPVHRPETMDYVPVRQSVCSADNRLPRLDRRIIPAFCFQLRTRRTVNCTGHAATRAQRGIRGVNNRPYPADWRYRPGYSQSGTHPLFSEHSFTRTSSHSIRPAGQQSDRNTIGTLYNSRSFLSRQRAPFNPLSANNPARLGQLITLRLTILLCSVVSRQLP